MQFQKAQRKNIPALLAIAGTTGSGKTFSALLIAAGLVGTKGKVAFIDTEMGRGSMYADEPLIKAVLPQGYDILELTPPYSPARYLEAMEAAKGYDCIIIDSVTHEWEGVGGCTDLAENNKLKGMPNWALAKREHKRFINRLLTMPTHVILCLRAREKTKPEVDKQTGKTVFVEYGVQPIQEKNFMFEMTFSVLLDPETHFPKIMKCPDSLKHIFPTDKLISKSVGEKIKQWSEGGAVVDLKARELRSRLTDVAHTGMENLKKAYSALKGEDAKSALVYKEELKKIAEEADSIPEPAESDKQPLF